MTLNFLAYIKSIVYNKKPTQHITLSTPCPQQWQHHAFENWAKYSASLEENLKPDSGSSMTLCFKKIDDRIYSPSNLIEPCCFCLVVFGHIISSDCLNTNSHHTFQVLLKIKDTNFSVIYFALKFSF